LEPSNPRVGNTRWIPEKTSFSWGTKKEEGAKGTFLCAVSVNIEGFLAVLLDGYPTQGKGEIREGGKEGDRTPAGGSYAESKDSSGWSPEAGCRIFEKKKIKGVFPKGTPS